MSENPNDRPLTNTTDNTDELSAGTIASVAFPNPGTQVDRAGTEPLMEPGGVGAADVAGDGDIGGVDQRDIPAGASTGDALADGDIATSDTDANTATGGGNAPTGTAM